MRIGIVLIVLMFISLNATAENESSIVVDSCVLRKMQIKIDDIKKEHQNFDYQKNYFTEAIDNQRNIYILITMLAMGAIPILVLIIGWFFTIDIRKFKKDIERFNKLEKHFHWHAGNQYLSYVEYLIDKHPSSTECKQKILKHYFMAMKEFLHCEEKEYFYGCVTSTCNFLEECKSSKESTGEDVIDYDTRNKIQNILNEISGIEELTHNNYLRGIVENIDINF